MSVNTMFGEIDWQRPGWVPGAKHEQGSASLGDFSGVQALQTTQIALRRSQGLVNRLERDTTKDRLKNRELVVVMDYPTQRTWRCVIPVVDMLANVTVDARYVPDSRSDQRWLGMALLGLASGGLWFGLLVVVFPNIIFAAIASLVMGFPPGAMWGYFVGPKLADKLLGKTPWAPPKPFWLLRRIWEGNSWYIQPIVYDGSLGRDSEAGQVNIHIASAWYHISEARGVKTLFTREKGMTHVIQLASMITVAGCAVGIVLFTVLATMD